MRAVYVLAIIAAAVTIGCAIAALFVPGERLGVVTAVAFASAAIVVVAAALVIGCAIVWPRVSAFQEPPRSAVRIWLRGSK